MLTCWTVGTRHSNSHGQASTIWTCAWHPKMYENMPAFINNQILRCFAQIWLPNGFFQDVSWRLSAGCRRLWRSDHGPNELTLVYCPTGQTKPPKPKQQQNITTLWEDCYKNKKKVPAQRENFRYGHGDWPFNEALFLIYFLKCNSWLWSICSKSA